MDYQSVALAAAGIIGSGVAVAHGIIMQKIIVKPIDAFFRSTETVSPTIRRLVAPLLHFTTYNWFLGGIALLIAAFCLEGEVKIAAGLFAGSSYLFGALCNCWATRGRHFGWMAYTVAVGLIILGLL